MIQVLSRKENRDNSNEVSIRILLNQARNHKKKKMKPVILNSQLSKNNLWNGCILASFAHAIMVTHYPGLPYEHSWGGDNYSVVDGRSYNTPNKRNH